MISWSAPSDVMTASNHYELLGIVPACGAGSTPVQYVLQLAAVDAAVVKDRYHRTIKHLEGIGNNPFTTAKVNQAFSVLSNDKDRKLYDLELMQNAAVKGAPWQYNT